MPRTLLPGEAQPNFGDALIAIGGIEQAQFQRVDLASEVGGIMQRSAQRFCK
jgi:hypothetical protein